MGWGKKQSVQGREELVSKSAPAPLPDSSEPSPPTFCGTRKPWRCRLVQLGWLVVGLLWLLPTLLLIGAGSWWLWQAGWLWTWLGLTGAVSLAGWLLAQWLRQTSRDTWGILVQPDPRWTPQDQAAWEKVEAFALQLQQTDLALDQPESVLQTFYDLLAIIARHYRPDSERPELEIPAPHVLRIIERVARDLRQLLVERVPGSHWLTLHDFYKLSRLAAWFQRFYRWFYGAYRVTQLATNPAAALVREVRDAALGQVHASTSQELKDGVISFCVRQAGRYAIQLYSGKVLLEEDSDRLPASRQTLRQLPKEGSAAPREPIEEPIRVLILGGPQTGKPLLLPMLLGQQAVPKQNLWRKLFGSQAIARRLWRPEGTPPIFLTDWPEYGPCPVNSKQLTRFETEVLQTDLVVLVCGPSQDNWRTDRPWLDQFRRIYQQHPERNRPPLIVLLGTEQPSLEASAAKAPGQPGQPVNPANSALPEGKPTGDLPGPPGALLSARIAELRRQLALADQEPVVPVCLASETPQQVQQRLLTAIRQVLPEADRARYARYYAQYAQQERWPRLWQQLRQAGPQAGKLAAQHTPNLLKQASQTLWQLGTGWFRKGRK